MAELFLSAQKLQVSNRDRFCLLNLYHFPDVNPPERCRSLSSAAPLFHILPDFIQACSGNSTAAAEGGHRFAHHPEV